MTENDENDNIEIDETNDNVKQPFWKNKYIIITIVVIAILVIVGIILLVRHYRNNNSGQSTPVQNVINPTKTISSEKQSNAETESQSSKSESKANTEETILPPYYPNIDILQQPFLDLPYGLNQVMSTQMTEHACSEECNNNPNCVWWAHNKNGNICALRGAINFPNVTTTFNDSAKHTFTFPNKFIAGNYLGNGATGVIKPSVYMCNQLCQETPNCLWSSFNNSSNTCWIQGPAINTYGVSTGIGSN